MQVVWQDFIVLAMAHFLAVASPGPDFYVVTKNTLKFGKQTGAYTAFGVGVAILLHVTYALLGFSLLVKTNDNLYTAIKWIGAIFLIYLGILSLRAKPESQDQLITHPSAQLSAKKAFMQGFLTNALNVKAMLFFLFLFTSIVKPDTSTSVKLFYGLWLSGFTFLWFYFIANVFGLNKVRQFFNRFGIWLDRGMGILLIIIALVLLLK